MSFRIWICAFIAAFGLGGCSTSPSPEFDGDQRSSTSSAAIVEGAELVDVSSEAVAPGGEEQPALADGDAQDPEPAPTEEQLKMRAMLQDIWMQPSFQRQLAQNWLRGSEVDPPLSLREGEFRLEVLDLITAGEPAKAVARLGDLQGPDASPVWDYMQGKLCAGNDDHEGAIREYVKAVNKYPSYRRAWQELGFAQMRANKHRSAAESFVEVISLGGSDPQTYGALGIAHFQAGHFGSAESAFRMVVMMDPREDRWKQALAECLGRQNKFADTINLLDGLIAKDRENPDLWKMQAFAYANLGDKEKAAANFEVVDRLGGADFVTLSNLGTIYLNDKLYTLAVDAYLKAIELEDRGGHEGVVQIANHLAMLSQYGEASRLVAGIEACYDDGLSQSDKLQLLKMRARLAASAGASEEQVALLQQIVQENPLDGDALLALAVHYQKEGDYEQAAFRYEQAARNSVFTAKAKRFHGQMLANQKRFSEAQSLLEASLQLSPEDDVQRLLDYVKSARVRAASKKSGK
jgi:tetratricopeptide (TPR) repeat protein